MALPTAAMWVLFQVLLSTITVLHQSSHHGDGCTFHQPQQTERENTRLEVPSLIRQKSSSMAVTIFCCLLIVT